MISTSDVIRQYKFVPAKFDPNFKSIKLVEYEYIEPNYLDKEIYSKNISMKDIDQSDYKEAYICMEIIKSGPRIIMPLYTRDELITFLEKIDSENKSHEISNVLFALKNITSEILFYHTQDVNICNYIRNNKFNDNLGIFTYSDEYSRIFRFSLNKIYEKTVNILYDTSSNFKNILIICNNNPRTSKNLNYHDKTNIKFVSNGLSKLLDVLTILNNGGNILFYSLNFSVSALKYVVNILSNFFESVEITDLKTHSFFNLLLFKGFKKIDTETIENCRSVLFHLNLYLDGKTENLCIFPSIYDSDYTDLLERSIKSDTYWWATALNSYLSTNKLQIHYHLELSLNIIKKTGFIDGRMVFFGNSKKNILSKAENVMYEFLYDNLVGQTYILSPITRRSTKWNPNLDFVDGSKNNFIITECKQIVNIPSESSKVISTIYSDDSKYKQNNIFREIFLFFGNLIEISKVSMDNQIIFQKNEISSNNYNLIFIENSIHAEPLLKTQLSKDPNNIFIIKLSIFTTDDNLSTINYVSKNFKYVFLHRSLLNIIDCDCYLCFTNSVTYETKQNFEILVKLYFSIYCSRAVDTLKLFYKISNSILDDKNIKLLQDIQEKIKTKYNQKFYSD